MSRGAAQQWLSAAPAARHERPIVAAEPRATVPNKPFSAIIIYTFMKYHLNSPSRRPKALLSTRVFAQMKSTHSWRSPGEPSRLSTITFPDNLSRIRVNFLYFRVLGINHDYLENPKR